MKYLVLTKDLLAQVDDSDFEKVSCFKWHASAQGSSGERFYACRKITVDGRRVKIWLHRFIMDLPHSLSGPDPLVVDHIDGDGLNCTRENLRVVSWSVNLEFVHGRLRRKRMREEPSL